MPINIPFVKLPWWPLGPPQGRGAYCHSQSSWALAMRESRHPPWKSHGETMANHGEPRHRAMAVLHLEMYLWLAANSSSRQLGSKILSIDSKHFKLMRRLSSSVSLARCGLYRILRWWNSPVRKLYWFQHQTSELQVLFWLDCLATPRQLCALAVLRMGWLL